MVQNMFCTSSYIYHKYRLSRTTTHINHYTYSTPKDNEYDIFVIEDLNNNLHCRPYIRRLIYTVHSFSCIWHKCYPLLKTSHIHRMSNLRQILCMTNTLFYMENNFPHRGKMYRHITNTWNLAGNNYSLHYM